MTRIAVYTVVVMGVVVVSRGVLAGPSDDQQDQPAAKEVGFVALFDGKSLAGWEGDPKSFRVEDGAIVAGTLKERIPRNEFLCTKKEYRRLRTATAASRSWARVPMQVFRFAAGGSPTTMK